MRPPARTTRPSQRSVPTPSVMPLIMSSERLIVV
jgi:hypothetical protein